MARKLLSLTSFCIASLCTLFAGCDMNTKASMQTTYPHLNEGRNNARMAIGYLRYGDTGYAAQKIQQALTEAPNDPLVLDAAGYYYEKSGDITLANDYFFKALTMAPASGTIRHNYGSFLCRNGYTRSAIEYYLQAARAPDYVNAARTYADARYCAKGLGDKRESAYYTGLLKNSNPQLTDNTRALT